MVCCGLNKMKYTREENKIYDTDKDGRKRLRLVIGKKKEKDYDIEKELSKKETPIDL